MRLLTLLCCTLLVTACSTPCEELSQKICECEIGSTAQSACERRAAQVESTAELSEAQQKQCEEWVESCDCNALDTPGGKRACGLAE